jgi:hypothetical protein
MSQYVKVNEKWHKVEGEASVPGRAKPLLSLNCTGQCVSPGFPTHEGSKGDDDPLCPLCETSAKIPDRIRMS